jgi:electron transfer flavoprotein alpha subunit
MRDTAMFSLIYIEPNEEKVDPTVLQIAARLRALPEEERGPIRGIAVGNHLEGKEKSLQGFLDELLVAEVSAGDEYNMEVVGRVLTDIVKSEGTGLVFLAFTHQGMELGPAIGANLGIPLLTGCVNFGLSDGIATVKRMIYEGKVSAAFEAPITQGAVFTVQKGSLKEVKTEGLGKSQESLPVRKFSRREEWKAEKTQIIQILKEPVTEGEDITKARILVSVGRGLGNPDTLPMVQELASLLGGVISCSRPVVDLGWLPAGRQVGLSGKTVSPVIYLALGISGQGNHVIGMETSKIIIAVNKDAAAPIFQTAHYGVIGDIHQFIPEFIEQARKEEK